MSGSATAGLVRRRLALGLLVVLTGCASVDVDVRVAPEADFAPVETWAHAPPAWDHPLVGPTVESEIETVLAEKGYRKVAVSQADVLVAYRASGVRRSKRKNAGDPDADYYVVENYIAGTVAIDVFPNRSREPWWHGQGEIDVYREQDAPAAAAKAVRAILKEFPARPEGTDAPASATP